MKRIVKNKPKRIECKLCNKKISGYGFSSHLKFKHNIDSNKYEEQFGEFRKKSTLKNIRKVNYVECKICKNTYATVGMNGHLRDTHNITVNSYIKKYGEYRKKYIDYNKRAIKNKIECKICKELFGSERLLTYHLRLIHNIKKLEYIKQYIFKNKMPKCKCGCKGNVTVLKKPPYKNDYIFGHWPTPNIKKYLTKKIRKVMSNKAKKRIQLNNGLSWPIRQSKSEIKFLDKIEKIYNKSIERTFPLKNKYYDGRYGNVLLEINGEYWHSKSKVIKNDKYKKNLAINNGYEIYTFIVNNIKEVDNKLKKYKKELDKIFN